MYEWFINVYWWDFSLHFPWQQACPHWQQETRKEKNTPRLFWVAMGCYPHSPYNIYIPQYLASKSFLISELQNWDKCNAALHWRQHLSVWGSSKSPFHRDATEYLWIWQGSRLPTVHVMFSIHLPSGKSIQCQIHSFTYSVNTSLLGGNYSKRGKQHLRRIYCTLLYSTQILACFPKLYLSN